MLHYRTRNEWPEKVRNFWPVGRISGPTNWRLRRRFHGNRQRPAPCRRAQITPLDDESDHAVPGMNLKTPRADETEAGDGRGDDPRPYPAPPRHNGRFSRPNCCAIPPRSNVTALVAADAAVPSRPRTRANPLRTPASVLATWPKYGLRRRYAHLAILGPSV